MLPAFDAVDAGDAGHAHPRDRRRAELTRSIRPWSCAAICAFAFAAAATAQTAPVDAASDLTVARGVLRAEQEAVLASTLSERILTMPYREGDSFPKGAVLVNFDCGRLGAELNAARAGARAEARTAEVQAELLRMGATGRADADIAVLKEKQSTAQANAIAQRMTGCRVTAPFAGRVVETLARPNESPPANEKLIRIVSDGALELHMVVPSKWLAWLKPGSGFDFKVDETGDSVKAVVQRISAAVDPVSQTVKIVCTIPKAPAGVLPGMSGQVTLAGADPARGPMSQAADEPPRRRATP